MTDERGAADLQVAEFAFPGPLRDELVAAILRGEKTATAGLLAEFEREDEPLPRVGERALVIDSEERPVAVIETTDVRVVRAADVELQFAIDEGEGFTSVADWRAAHEAFRVERGRRPTQAELASRLDVATRSLQRFLHDHCLGWPLEV